jgi:Na+(H+)/acetate symporter ActP
VDKALIVVVIIVLLFALFGGMEGILWCHVFAVPMGIVLAIVAKAMGWFD